MPALEIGSILRNRYRVSRILGQSKLSSAYVVDDIHLAGNVWTAKEMRIVAADNAERQQIISQFSSDLRRIAELGHPNLAKILDFFVEGQNIYVIREFVPAYDLESLLDKTGAPMRERDVLNCGIQLADVLSYLVKFKFPAVFFRDLTLDNILLNSDGSLKLTDIGLAGVFQTETDPQRLRNIGSTNYASPETFDGEGIFDERSLIYSLGTILFHISTKQNPAQTLFNLPSIETLNPAVSKKTRKIIEKATRNDPNLRYQTLLEMKKDMLDAIGSREVEKIEVSQKPKNKTEKSGGGNIINYALYFIVMLLTAGIVYLLYKLLS